MAGLFETSDVSGAMSSAVTPKEGVAPVPSRGPELLGMAVDLGMEVGTQYQENKITKGLGEIAASRGEELEEKKARAYENKFEALAMGMGQGMPTSQANARARALLAEAKNSIPWAAERLNATYSGFFGGGGKAGFELDPMEEAAYAHQKTVMERAAAEGISLRDAEVGVQLDARNTRNEAILKSITLEQSNAAHTFRNVYYDNLNTASMQVNTIARSLLPEGQTTLEPTALQSAKSSVDNMALQMQMKLRAQSRSEDGRMKIDQKTYEDLSKEIDDWATKEKGLLDSRSYLEALKSVNETGDLLATLHARELWYAVHLANKGGGQALVQSYIDGVQNPKYIQNLMEANPAFAALVDQDTGKVMQLTASSFNRLLGMPEPDDLIRTSKNAMQNGGAVVAASIMADPKNVGLTQLVLEQVGSEDEQVSETSSAAVRELGRNAPIETSKMLTTTLKGLANRFPEESWKVLINSMDGMNQNVLSSFYSEGQAFPDYIQVVPATHPDSRSFSLATEDGEEVPDSVKSVIAHQYAVLRNRPEIVERFEESLGIPLTPDEVLEIFVNDKIPEKLVERAATQTEPFKPYRARSGLSPTGTRVKPYTPEEAERAKKGAAEQREAISSFAKEYGPTSSNVVKAAESSFSFSKRMAKKTWNFRKEVQKRMFEREEKMISPEGGMLFVPPEQVIENVSDVFLTPEQASEIKKAVTLKEKKALAKEYGIPESLLNKTPQEITDMLGIPR